MRFQIAKDSIEFVGPKPSGDGEIVEPELSLLVVRSDMDVRGLVAVI
jgi:hypothetical protein